MNDPINRQDAIDALDCSMTITGRKNAETVFEHMRSIRDRIKALPSAEAIPVSWIEERIINAEDAGQTNLARMWLELINGYRREHEREESVCRDSR